jgi:hypothetical protein
MAADRVRRVLAEGQARVVGQLGQLGGNGPLLGAAWIAQLRQLVTIACVFRGYAKLANQMAISAAKH